MSEQGVHEGLREPPISRVDRDARAVVVHLAGELDLYNAHEIREVLLDECAHSPERLIVELGSVSFIDSTALGVLVEARSKMPNRRAFLVAAPGPDTRRALEISGLDRHFGVHDTVDDARDAKI